MSGAVGNKNHFIHGFTNKERLYNIWKSMRQRCRNRNGNRSKSYVDKGITVCEEWSEYSSFRKWALANGYKEGLTLDRIDNDGHYEPSNCRWVTYAVQANNKSSNHYLEFEGRTRTLSEWSKEVGISNDTLKRRIYSGWDIEKALTTPVRKHKPYRVNKRV